MKASLSGSMMSSGFATVQHMFAPSSKYSIPDVSKNVRETECNTSGKKFQGGWRLSGLMNHFILTSVKISPSSGAQSS